MIRTFLFYWYGNCVSLKLHKIYFHLNIFMFGTFVYFCFLANHHEPRSASKALRSKSHNAAWFSVKVNLYDKIWQLCLCTEGEGALPEPARGEARDYREDLQAPYAGTAGSANRYSLSDMPKNHIGLCFCIATKRFKPFFRLIASRI
jgi:hypothetical protein